MRNPFKKADRQAVLRGDLVAHEFEVWYTYTSFLNPAPTDVYDAARRLIDKGIARVALLSTGEILWRGTDGSTVSDRTVTSESDPAEPALPAHPDLPPLDSFENEVLARAYVFWAVEDKLYQQNPDLLPRSVRLFPGACLLGDDEHRYWLYPIVNLYESGVILVSFVVFSGADPVGLSSLVDDCVNLSDKQFGSAHVPPAVAREIPDVTLSASRWARWRTRHARRGHHVAVKEQTWTDAVGDFSFDFAPLPLDEGGQESLQTLAHALMDVVASASTARAPQQRPRSGAYWTGRPYIHLVRHSEQKATASANLTRHADSFTSLLNRTASDLSRRNLFTVPSSPRSFEDVGIHMTSSAGLFAWSGLAHKRHAHPPSARTLFVIEMQVNAEVTEHAYMLARSLLHAADSPANTDRVLDLRERLARLQLALDSPSRFGEVTDQVKSSLSAFGFDTLIERIDQRLALRHAQAELRERRRDNSSRTALTVALGLLAAPTLGTAFVGPLWRVLDLPLPSSSDASALIHTGVAFCIMFALVLIVLRPSWKRRNPE